MYEFLIFVLIYDIAVISNERGKNSTASGTSLPK